MNFKFREEVSVVSCLASRQVNRERLLSYVPPDKGVFDVWMSHLFF
jgi:hypothetical protein